MNEVIKEVASIQSELCIAEGMIKQLLNSARNGEKAEIIACSLEVLHEYVSKRVDRLDEISLCYLGN